MNTISGLEDTGHFTRVILGIDDCVNYIRITEECIAPIATKDIYFCRIVQLYLSLIAPTSKSLPEGVCKYRRTSATTSGRMARLIVSCHSIKPFSSISRSAIPV